MNLCIVVPLARLPKLYKNFFVSKSRNQHQIYRFLSKNKKANIM